jgi:hypothetical protein
MNPTLAGFVAFIANVMQITSSQLSPSDPAIALSYNLALATVNQQLCAIPNCNPAQPTVYAWAVYNLAGDQLINYASDVPPSTFFADMRASLNINAFVSGVLSSQADATTSSTVAVPQSLNQLTLGDLQNLKTPWGRVYLSLAQKVGTMWGVS